MDYSTPSLVAVATGIIGSAWASGAMASISLTGVPAARAVPASTAQIWSVLFDRGLAIIPRLAAGSALLFAYAAYSTYGVPSARDGTADTWKGYVVAGAFAVSMVPYTFLAMHTTNMALKEAARGVPGINVTELVGKWTGLNLFRCLLPLGGALTGLATLVKSL